MCQPKPTSSATPVTNAVLPLKSMGIMCRRSQEWAGAARAVESLTSSRPRGEPTHMLALALLLATAPAANDAAPNIWGQTGVVRIGSARAPGNLRFDVGAQGFALVANDYLIDGSENALIGGNLSASAAFLDVIELSLASRSAGNTNSAQAASAFSV